MRQLWTNGGGWACAAELLAEPTRRASDLQASRCALDRGLGERTPIAVFLVVELHAPRSEERTITAGAQV